MNSKSIYAVLWSTLAFAMAPAAFGQAAPGLFFEGDMVRGPIEGSSLAGCVLSSQFKRNEPVVWRIRVLDARTGQSVDSKGLKSLVVVLPDGSSFPARYGPHPRGGSDGVFEICSSA